MQFDVRPSVLNVRHNFPSRKQVFSLRKLFPLFAGEECGTWVKWSSLAAVNMKNILGTASPSTQGAGPRPRTSTTDQAHPVSRSCLGGQFCQTNVAKCHFTHATEGFNKPGKVECSVSCSADERFEQTKATIHKRTWNTDNWF